MSLQPVLFIVDDDAAVRDALSLLGEALGLTVEAYVSAEDFLKHYTLDRLGCLILDLRLPGMDGMELQANLTAREAHLPIIMITGHGNHSEIALAQALGALCVIEKPFNPQELIDCIQRGMAQAMHV